MHMACSAFSTEEHSTWRAHLHAERGAPQAIQLPDLDCDERYFSLVRCAGHQFLFSRREFSCCDMWDTVLRIAPNGTFMFGPSEVTLDHGLNMSHNTAFLCVANRTIVAIGGQLPDGIFTPDRLRWHPGILRRHADATVLPLAWSQPSLVASAMKTKSHCVDARFREGCDFDGKIAAIMFKGRLLIFSRANMLRPTSHNTSHTAAEIEAAGGMQPTDAGGRYVQVAEADPLFSRFGWAEARRFRPIRLEGFDRPMRTNNIYFWTVQRIGRHALVALFPAVLHGKGGVWCSTSTDGVRWARPLRVMRTSVVHGVRTSVHPVEHVGDSLDAWSWWQPRPRLVAAQNGSYPDEASQPWSKYDAVLLHHDVYFHLAAREPGCKNIPQPHLCAYAYRRKGVATRCAAIRHAFQRHERAPSQV